MTFPAVFTLFYAFVMGGGGWAGWRLARSRPSLLGGALVGGLALIGSLLMFGGNPAGRGTALLGAVLAVLFSGWRASRGILEREPVGRPAGILALSGLEVAVLLLTRPEAS